MEVCKNAGICGGCFYQGTPYEEQLKIKESQVKELLDGVIRGAYEFESIIPSSMSLEYRNKMEFTFGDCQKDGPLTLGMHQKRSFFNIIDADCCQLTNPDFGLILSKTRNFFSKLGVSYKHRKSHIGYLRHLMVRRAVKTGEILVDLITTTQREILRNAYEANPDVWDEMLSRGNCTYCNIGELASSGISEEEVAVVLEKQMLSAWCEVLKELETSGKLQGVYSGILRTRNDSRADAVINEGTEILYGKDYFYEELLGLKFKITPFSFFQTNSVGAEKLYEKAREYAGVGVDEKPVIYDLYCGTGTISQIMSKVASTVVGVEIVEEAVKAARENADLNGIQNCKFIAGDVLKVIAEGGELMDENGCISQAPRPDLIILDPPREGIHQKALSKIIDYGVKRMVYVSCKVTSLARDLVMLQSAGYVVQKVACVDQFPYTNNIETVALLTYEDK